MFGVGIYINTDTVITRIIESTLMTSLKPGNVTGLFGARRTGKTILMESIRKKLSTQKVLHVQGENLDVSEILSSQRLSVLQNFVNGYDFLFVDEAQKIRNIGLNLKLIVDSIPGISVFVTGSSAFDLRGNIGEPLTGRSTFYNLYPFALGELEEDFLTSKENLEKKLIFGLYPQVVNAINDEERIKVLESIRDGYLLRDILELDNLKDSIFIINLLRLLAFQIGQDVSLAELAANLRVSRKTVERYLELLEKSFILFSTRGFSRNLRKEFSKSPRYYFWDNGIRNSVISNFGRLAVRDDTGRLWENFCISERMKINHYNQRSVNCYFWRTYDQKEIDLIEESNGQLSAFEFKWSVNKGIAPKDFIDNYPGSTFAVINPETYLPFIKRKERM